MSAAERRIKDALRVCGIHANGASTAGIRVVRAKRDLGWFVVKSQNAGTIEAHQASLETCRLALHAAGYEYKLTDERWPLLLVRRPLTVSASYLGYHT